MDGINHGAAISHSLVHPSLFSVKMVFPAYKTRWQSCVRTEDCDGSRNSADTRATGTLLIPDRFIEGCSESNLLCLSWIRDLFLHISISIKLSVSSKLLFWTYPINFLVWESVIGERERERERALKYLWELHHIRRSLEKKWSCRYLSAITCQQSLTDCLDTRT